MSWSEDNAIERRLTALEHACRCTVGDRLRSVTVDAPEWSGTVYRRSDLPAGVDEPVREAATGPDAVLADGGRAVEEFEHRYVARFQDGETSVVATAGGLKLDRESELSAVVRGVLSE